MESKFAAGRIDVILGPMFAGKTTELIRRVQRAELQRLRCIFLSYSENSLAKTLTTHDCLSVPATACPLLMPLWEHCFAYEVIAIDEGQFFPDIPEFSQLMANSGKTVIIAGLDGTYQRKPFGRFLELIASCESITKLSAICPATGGEAFFTRRTVASTEIELIGGTEAYAAASRTAYFDRATDGQNQLILGPVNSRKTTELYRLLNRYLFAQRTCVLVRFSGADPVAVGKVMPVIVTNELPGEDVIGGFDVIGVDEGHRYDGIEAWADRWANDGKRVIIAAADSDEEQEPFSAVLDLLPRCERIEKLQAVCPKTGLPAPFSVLEGPTILPVSRHALLGGPALRAFE
jgi:thymidine kinase